MIMEDAAQKEIDLRQGVVVPLKQLGHNVEVADVDAQDHSILQGVKDIGGDILHDASLRMKETLKGEAPDSRIRGTRAGRFLDFIRRRGKPTQLWK